MKKLFFIIASLLIINISVAQELLHLFPETATQNSSLFLIVQANQTHLYSSDSNLIILTNNVDTIEQWIHNSYSDELFTSANLQMTPSNTGYYDMYLYNNIDDTIYLKNALYIAKHILKKNLEAPYFYNNNTTSTIAVSESNSHFISGGDLSAFFVNNENDTLNVQNIYAPTEDSLIITFTADASEHGIYNLFTYNNTDSIAYAPNIINIKNSAYTQIDTVSPDTLMTYDMETPFTVYGHKTHFTQDDCAIYLEMDFQFPIHDVIVINDSLLTFIVNIPIACKDLKPETFMFYIHNNIDGRLAFISKVYIFGSINSSIQNTNITLFPNPVIGAKFTLEFEEITKHNSTLIIYNETGQEIKNEQLSDGIKSKIIDVSGLDQGIYFYSISTNGGQTNAGKFIIH